MLDESDSEVIGKFVKELYLCDFLFGVCLKRELKRDVIGSLDDGNDEKEIREMERCFWDVSEFGNLD